MLRAEFAELSMMDLPKVAPEEDSTMVQTTEEVAVVVTEVTEVVVASVVAVEVVEAVETEDQEISTERWMVTGPKVVTSRKVSNE